MPIKKRKSKSEKNQGARLLREWRKGNELTLDGLAEKLGTNKFMLSRYETGVHKPGTRRAILIKELCGVSVESWYL